MFLNEGVKKTIWRYSRIDTDNNKYVVHKAYPRVATIANTAYFNWNGSTKAERNQMYEEASKKYIY